MKSVMTHQFSRIPATDTPRSTFDRGHGLKTAFDSGYLVPIEVQEVLPGDEVNFDASFLARLGPCVTPPMDNVFLDTQWFFVPSRLLWTNFTRMMGERVNPNDSIDFVVPQIGSGSRGFAVGSLADYFGIPTNIANLSVNALPFRAYAKIWDDWYRDENLQNSIIQSSDDLGDSAGTIDWNTLKKRGKRHDYATSCLPWPQKGEGVEIPIAGTAPVILQGDIPGASVPLTTGGGTDVEGFPALLYRSNASGLGSPNLGIESQSGTVVSQVKSAEGTAGYHLRADLSEATSATINSLRLAFQLQKQLEADARGGTRYCEILANSFGTICPDARLQRSEYLGGSSDRIVFAPIAQTSASGTDTAQGNLVSQGKCVCGCRWHKSFTEHGYIIGLASVRCDLNYQQGLDRMWSRKSRFDFFWPALQCIGEQAVLNKEVYAQGTDDDEDVFGYQERYAEYRYNPSKITGKMRSGISGSLDVWHLAQYFTTLPVLNGNFIEENPPLKRVLAVQDEPEIILDAYLGQKWTRGMMLYSVPGLIDHF